MANSILVVGGGPAGIAAARSAAKAGAEVTLISDGEVGGRAGWHSLVPSKVWLAAAETAGWLEAAPGMGLQGGPEPRPNPSAVLERIREVAQNWNEAQAAELHSLGVKIRQGEAALNGPTSVRLKRAGQVAEEELQADAIIITAGSVPVFPPKMKPDGERVLAPRFASKLQSLPPAMIVIGAGPTGSEFAHLFNRLGVEVTWIIDQFGVLPGYDPQAGQLLAESMENRGVRLVQGVMAEEVEATSSGVVVLTSNGQRYAADAAFIGIGRRPDLNRLNLAAAGLDLTEGRIVTDEYGRTAATGLYAAGDVTGGPMVANRAISQAKVAGRHAAGAATMPFQADSVVSAVYTEPQLAQVGQLAAEENGLESVRLEYSAALKTRLGPEAEGFLKLAYDPENGQVRGAVAAGPHAADLLAPLALAISLRASVEQAAAVSAAHPTLSELAFLACESAARQRSQ